MILYNTDSLLNLDVWHRIFLRTLHRPWAVLVGVFAAALAAFLSLLDELDSDALKHPAVYFNGLGFVLGFLLVHRVQIAYSRYFEAISSVEQFGSCLKSVAVQVSGGFLGAACRSAAGRRERGDKQPQDDDETHAVAELGRFAHLLVCYHTVALKGLRHQEMRALRCLHQAEMLSEQDYATARTAYDRSLMLQCEMHKILVATAWGVDQPVAGRVYQLLSDANGHLANMRKISTTPFPFPFV